MELIDKEKVVAEIERRIEHNTEWKDACKTLAVLAANQAIEEDKQILSIINSLEVEEVDLDEIANHEDIKNAFKAGYELGMSVSNKAQKGE